MLNYFLYEFKDALFLGTDKENFKFLHYVEADTMVAVKEIYPEYFI